MKAIYDPKAKTKFNRNHRKEGKCYFSELSIIDGTPRKGDTHPLARAPITARIYGTGGGNYCCLWVHSNSPSHQLHTSGSDYAGGYGHHSPSAALSGTICNAGFALDKSISGVGEQAMEDALLAIAKCIGIKRPLLHRAHQ